VRKVFESIAEELLRIDRAEQRAAIFEVQHEVRTLGAPYYTASEKATNRIRYNRKLRLSNILNKAKIQERARIVRAEGTRPWPPMLRWPFNVVV
jgi:hypothetical protein